MPRTLSDAMIQSANALETDEIYALLLTISHDDLTDDIRVTDQTLGVLPILGEQGIVSRDNEFVRVPFEFQLPGDPENGTPFTKIKIDNIDRGIVAAVRGLRGFASIVAEVVLLSDPDTVEISLDGFSLVGARYNRLFVEGTISLELFDTEPYPGLYYLPSTTPGVF